jgi:fructokinase
MIVVCGEALIDLVPAGPSATWRATNGGGPANTAVALARLGTPAALACRLSGDAFGRQLREHLRASGVDLRLAVAAREPTTLAVVSLDERGSADYQFYVNGTADWQWSPDELPAKLPPGTQGLHVGTLASMLPPGAAVLYEWIAAHRDDAVVTYDVNVRPALLPDRAAFGRQVAGWLDLAHVVKASHDDLAWLYPDTDPIDAARAWQEEHAIAVVLLTLGAAGAVAVPRGADPLPVAGIHVDVVDTVGAGDTFAAAFLHWLASREMLRPDLADRASIAAAVRYAVAAAALACTHEGAQPPTPGEVEQLLADNDPAGGGGGGPGTIDRP